MDEKENLQETAQEEVSADLSYDEFLTEDPADPDDTQEFSLEDIMKEFGASVPEEPAEEAPEEIQPEAAQQLPEELEDTPEEPPMMPLRSITRFSSPVMRSWNPGIL